MGEHQKAGMQLCNPFNVCSKEGEKKVPHSPAGNVSLKSFWRIALLSPSWPGVLTLCVFSLPGIVDHLSKDELAAYDAELERELQGQEGRSMTGTAHLCNPSV